MFKGIKKFILQLTRNALERSGNSTEEFDKVNGEIDSGSAKAFDNFTSSFSNGISNWWKGFTGSGLTQRDVELNQMNMQNVEDTASRQIAGYNKAGVNPALMYSGGASNSAPNSSAVPTTGSMSELMQAIMMPLQMKMMKAQIGNVQAQTSKTIAESEQIKQIMDWYPRLSQANLDKLVSSYGLDIANINKVEAETAIAEFEKVIKSAEAENAPALYKARVALEEAKTDTEKANAASALANAAWTAYETDYTKNHNGARPSSSSILALVDAISAMTGLSADSVGAKKVTSQIIEDFKNPLGFYKKGVQQGKAIAKKGKSWLGNKWQQFKDWSNREKRLF